MKKYITLIMVFFVGTFCLAADVAFQGQKKYPVEGVKKLEQSDLLEPVNLKKEDEQQRKGSMNMKFVTALSSPIGVFNKVEVVNPYVPTTANKVTIGVAASKPITTNITLREKKGYIGVLEMGTNTTIAGNIPFWRTPTIHLNAGGDIKGRQLLAKTLSLSAANKHVLKAPEGEIRVGSALELYKAEVNKIKQNKVLWYKEAESMPDKGTASWVKVVLSEDTTTPYPVIVFGEVKGGGGGTKTCATEYPSYPLGNLSKGISGPYASGYYPMTDHNAVGCHKKTTPNITCKQAATYLNDGFDKGARGADAEMWSFVDGDHFYVQIDNRECFSLTQKKVYCDDLPHIFDQSYNQYAGDQGFAYYDEMKFADGHYELGTPDVSQCHYYTGDGTYTWTCQWESNVSGSCTDTYYQIHGKSCADEGDIVYAYSCNQNTQAGLPHERLICVCE